MVALALAALGVALVACGGGGGAATSPTADPVGTKVAAAPTPASAPLRGSVAVFAASSLTDVFRAAGLAFMKANPEVVIELNFQSSSVLATQVEQAAPADVFASADTTTMQRVAGKGLVAGAPVDIARNQPVIVVPSRNEAGVVTAKDLAKPGVQLVLGGPDVPIGNYARQVIDKLAADPTYGATYRDATLRNVVSNEANARAILAKVELGVADAGIVYKTDAQVSGAKVRTIVIPDASNVVATYPIAVTKSARNPAAAAAFIAFLRGADGQRLLREAGFDPIP